MSESWTGGWPGSADYVGGGREAGHGSPCAEHGKMFQFSGVWNREGGR